MPTFPQHPDAADYTSSPWTHPDTGIQWTSTLVGTATYRWQEYIAPAETGGGASAWADLTDKATAPITTDNTALAAALGLLAPKASPTFTGTVTIPSGASISGYLTTAAAASTYQPIGSYAPSTGIAQTAVSNLVADLSTINGYIVDLDLGKAPSTGIAASAITGTAVTLSGTQTITGEKTFSAGVIANGFATPAGSYLIDGFLAIRDGSFSAVIDATGEISADRIYKAPNAGGTLALTNQADGKVNLASAYVTGTLPIANGGTGSTSGNITGTGALTFTAGGTNQNITLTPSGTGIAVIPKLGVTGGVYLDNDLEVYSNSQALTRSNSRNIMFGGNASGMMLPTNFGIKWGSISYGSTTDIYGNTKTLGIHQGTAGQLLIGSGGATSFAGNFKATNGDLVGTLSVTGITTATGGIVLGTKTVGTLPTASSNTYLSFIITDALAPTLGVTVASGGSAKCAVRSNGTAGAVPTGWIVTEIL